jgi:hypothetical protein
MTFIDFLTICFIAAFLLSALILGLGIREMVRGNRPLPALHEQIDWTSRAEVTSDHSQ